MDTTIPYEAILAAWQLGRVAEIVQPASGTINQIVRAAIAGRYFFLRRYRHPERAVSEHAAIAHARARGFPAVAPLPLLDGATILVHDGAHYALYPQAPGRQHTRDQLTPTLLAAMGRNLAALHRALRDLPRAGMHQRTFVADRDRTLAGIARIAAVIAGRDGSDSLDQIARTRLASRREWLQAQPPTAEYDPAILSEQPIHGDYQETNLFFGADETVCAVIDWDQGYLASRAWEIIRVLDFVCGFAPAPTRHLLMAYREGHDLSLADLDRAAATYGLLRAHDLWLYEAYYFQANRRVGQFITPGTFVPVAVRWAALRAQLAW